MGKWNNFKSKIADDLEIPNSVMSDNFGLRMHGNNKVVIENHQGITVYENEEVGIKTKNQYIYIKGSKFKIEEISTDKLIIKGNIDEIKFVNKG